MEKGLDLSVMWKETPKSSTQGIYGLVEEVILVVKVIGSSKVSSRIAKDAEMAMTTTVCKEEAWAIVLG